VKKAKPAVDFNDEDKVEERNEAVEERQQREAREQREAIKMVMSTGPGRMFVNMVLSELTPRNGRAFTGNALTTSYNVALLEKGLELRDRIEGFEPDHFFTMIAEAREREHNVA